MQTISTVMGQRGRRGNRRWQEQKKKYLGRMCDDFLFAAYGVTEPNAGSDSGH